MLSCIPFISSNWTHYWRWKSCKISSILPCCTIYDVHMFEDQKDVTLRLAEIARRLYRSRLFDGSYKSWYTGSGISVHSLQRNFLVWIVRTFRTVSIVVQRTFDDLVGTILNIFLDASVQQRVYFLWLDRRWSAYLSTRHLWNDYVDVRNLCWCT